MAMIKGIIHLDSLTDGSGMTQLIFAPTGSEGRSRPLGIETLALVRFDLLSPLWNVPENIADAKVAELERTGSTQIEVTVDEEAVAPLFDKTAA